MDVAVLSKMSFEDLVSEANARGVNPEWTKSRSMVIQALKTYPNDVNVNTKYVDGSSIGDIVAFRTDDYKIKSAKICMKSSKNKKLKLVTSYGKVYIVNYSDVVWVNSNGYWPKWIYTLMKENENAEANVK